MTELPWDWIVLTLIIVLLIYTMIVIREEKRSYQESAITYQLGPITFPTPSWWGLIEQNERKLIFKRTDTRYDWQAHLYWVEENWEETSKLTLEEYFTSLLKDRELEFDEINSVIHSPEDFKDHPLVVAGDWEICRVEGTASKAVIERVYYDAYLIRDHQLKRHLYCESESSVLNGLVEGPYFEEMMTQASKEKA